MSRVYYNEYDAFAAAWLRNLMQAGLIPEGDVDERSIIDVRADDLRAYRQCHFFAGIGGWSHALRLAGWADDREIWTGSCPCQPFSVAGKGKGKSDERHLWPVFFELIRNVRPSVVMGEQVAGKAGYGWFDGVHDDLAGEDYASRAVDIPACAVNAPHVRQRLYWVAYANSQSIRGRLSDKADAAPGDDEGEAWQREWLRADASSDGQHSGMADADCSMLQTWAGDRLGIGAEGISGRASAHTGDMGYPNRSGQREHGGAVAIQAQQPSSECSGSNTFWDDAECLLGSDGKTRRVKPGVRLLVDGVPNRVGRLRGYGNAIVPPLAAEVIKAFMEVMP